MGNNTNTKNKKFENELIEYLKVLEEDPGERAAINKALQREQKKLAKCKETEFAAMFLSTIKF